MRFFAAALLALSPTLAFAQSANWEVEFSGGVALSRLPSSGEVTFPAPGETITTTSVLFPSRSVPSWFFGDGAALLNGVAAQFGTTPIVPLDAALGSVSLNSAASPLLGAKLRRQLTPTWAVEVSLDVMRGSTDLTGALVDAAETTRASFEPAFASLFATSPLFANPTVSATLDAASGSSRDIALTGALVRSFAAAGAFQPYVTLGGGVLMSSGNPSLTLRGQYAFSIDNAVPISETDVLTVRAAQDRKLVALIGGGVRRDLSPRLGLRLDGRAIIGGQGARLLVDASPEIATGTPADFLESFTNPAIQFSSNISTGRRSTLGAPGLDAFALFAGTGIQIRVLISAGLVVRF